MGLKDVIRPVHQWYGDVKTLPRKVLTSKQCAKHPFVGLNTQQLRSLYVFMSMFSSSFSLTISYCSLGALRHITGKYLYWGRKGTACAVVKQQWAR